MYRRRRLVRYSAIFFGAIAYACGRPSSSFTGDEVADIERAAITSVFLTYEHPAQLVFWRGAPRESPVFDELSLGDSLVASDIAVDRLRLGIPVTTIDERELEQFFREHPDAWETWFRLRRGSGGIVVITAPVRQSATGTTIVLGRRCGEHCRAAWRVRVVKSPAGRWATEKVESIALPRP